MKARSRLVTIGHNLFNRLFQLNKEIWLFLCLTAISAAVFLNFVNLTPHIDNNFFFSSNDPQFQNEKIISESFTRKDTLLIINAQGPISSPDYMRKIHRLTESMLKLTGVTEIRSIA